MSTRLNAQSTQKNPPAARGLDPREAGATAEALVLRIVEATENAVRQIREDTERALAEETEAILADAEREAALIGRGPASDADGEEAMRSRPERFHGLHSVPGPSLEPEFARGVAAQVRTIVDEATAAADDIAQSIRAEAERDAVQIRTRARAEAEATLAQAERRAEAARGERMLAEALVAESSTNLGRIASQITAQVIALERSGLAGSQQIAPLLTEASSAIARAGYEIGRVLEPAAPPAASSATPGPQQTPTPRPQPAQAPHPYGPAYRTDAVGGPFVRWQARFGERGEIAPEPGRRKAVELGA